VLDDGRLGGRVRRDLAQRHERPVSAVPGLAVATLGLVNGLLIGVLNLPSLAVTLGRSPRTEGSRNVLEGEARSNFPGGFPRSAAAGIDNELPASTLLLMGFALVLSLLLHATWFGRYLYSDRSTVRPHASPIPVTRVRVSVFALPGLMAGFAASCTSASSVRCRRTRRRWLRVIDVVTAVVLGGVDIFGGTSRYSGPCSRSSSSPSCGMACSRQPERRHAEHGHRRAPARRNSRWNLVRAAHGRPPS
jgi:ribose/xylose/arabinose/galactoside ABC-type transport system permease subunit